MGLLTFRTLSFHPRTETDSVSETLCYLEYKMMDKLQSLSNLIFKCLEIRIFHAYGTEHIHINK
jgi:hypothetical protein